MRLVPSDCTCTVTSSSSQCAEMSTIAEGFLGKNVWTLRRKSADGELRSISANTGTCCEAQADVRTVRSALAPQRIVQGNSSRRRSEEHTSELQSLMRISYAVFCLITTQHELNSHYHLFSITITQI